MGLTIGQKNRERWWNHFLEVTKKSARPNGLTDKRLEKAKEEILEDRDFWFHTLVRFSVMEKTPEEYLALPGAPYEQLRGQFWSMVRERVLKELE